MIINGKQLAQERIEQLARIFSTRPKVSTLHIINMGRSPVTDQFIGIKERYAQRIGVATQVHYIDAESSQDTLEENIEAIKANASQGDAIIIQLPLPDHIDKQKMLNLVPFEYDIDVLNQEHYEAFSQGTTLMIPPVAGAIWCVLATYHLIHKDARIVIVGSGRLVGIPVAKILERGGFSCAVIDKHTPPRDRKDLLRTADIIITGAGDPWFLEPDDIQEGVILIDAGTSESENTMKGDIHPDCYVKARAYTPVPGGIGPLTVAMLFDNMSKNI